MVVQNNCPKPYLPKYRDHVLKSGLKFENDRTFKNRLIAKSILLMAVLVVLATCAFVAWSKLRRYHQNSGQSSLHVTSITKVLIDYDLDSESLEHTLLPDVRTQFVPPELTLPNFKTPFQDAHHEPMPKFQRFRRKRRNATFGDEDSLDRLEELVWVKVSDKTKRNVKVDSVSSGGVATDQAKLHKITFWSGKEDAFKIREYQAKKMSDFMDASADPCQDFYQYACGRWLDHNAIPEDRAAFDTFEILRDSLDAVLRDLLEERNDTTSSLSNQSAIEKAKILYRSCMDEETLEKRGNTPLLEFIDSLGGWPVLNPNWNDSNFDWVELSAKLRLFYNDVMLTHWIGQDFMISSNYIIQFDQTNLGLSTRDYFLKEQNKDYKEAYKIFLEQVALLMGAEPITAARDAAEIVAFETSLANITLPQDVRRNISEMYEKLTVADLELQIPHIAWRRYLSIVLGEPVQESEPVVLFARKYYMSLGELLNVTSSRTIANYMMWRFVKHRINNLDSKYQDAKQNFLHALFGREKSPPRWTVCVHHVNGHMGMALGSMFVNRYFDENSKNNTVDMTQSILETFEDMIDGITWIDAETRQLAKNKVRAIILRIGYPDFILDHQQLDHLFQNVTVADNKYFENSLAALQFTAKFEIDRLRTVVDKKYWNVSPAIVNAYYHRNKNQIMFPAGILQPPFYHRHFPRSLNFGGIGVVIGHEIIHGFDDKGRLYDLEGNLNRWWKANAIEEFHQRAKCLIDQYNSYMVQEIDMHIDGVNTQGENIADNGGIKQAFRAYEKWVNINGPENETLPGINATNYQLFFINFAQVWCGAMRPEASRNKIQTSAHPPGKIRVIGTLTNSEEFAKVFNCPLESRMNPKEKCTVW